MNKNESLTLPFCFYSDIKPFIPNLIHAIENPKEVIETVHKLSATTFVQTVDYSALSVMSPLLVRGLAERSIATKRQCARIIENMTKLVDHPSDVAPFLPKLLPILETAKVEVSDPECRDVCEKAYDILVKKGDMTKAHVSKLDSIEALTPVIKSALGTADSAAVPAHVMTFVSNLCLSLMEIKMLEEEAWVNTLMPYLAPFTSEEAVPAVAKTVCACLR